MIDVMVFADDAEHSVAVHGTFGTTRQRAVCLNACCAGGFQPAGQVLTEG